jgi:hypothetical protein
MRSEKAEVGGGKGKGSLKAEIGRPKVEGK